MTAAGLGEIRRWQRRHRRRHHDRSLGDLLTDLYIVGFFVALYGWAFLDASRGFLRSPLVGDGDPAEQRWLVIAVLLTGAGLGWAALRAMGPIFVGPAAQSWIASAPVDRRALLLPRLATVVATATGVAALLGLSLGALGDGLAGGALLGAAAGLLAGGGAAAVQGNRRVGWAADLPGRLLISAGAMVALGVVVLHVVGGRVIRPEFSPPLGVPLLGVGLGVVTTAVAVHRAKIIDRAVMSTGAQFASSAAAAAVMLDPTLIADLVESRRWRAIGRVRSGRFRAGPRWWPLVQAEMRRARRRRGALLGWAALVLVHYAVALAVPGLAGAAHLVTAYLAGDRFTGGLRAVTRSPGLRRALGGGDNQLKLAHLALPALAVALFYLVTATQLRPLDAALVAGLVGAIYRSGTRPPLSYDGPVVETPFGLIQVDLLRQLGRGWDVVALLVIVDLIFG